MIVKDTATDGIELNNQSDIFVMTSSHRAIRGRSFAVLISDALHRRSSPLRHPKDTWCLLQRSLGD